MSEKNSFEAWLTSALSSDPPLDIAAYNFDLAKSHDWVVELIGASAYDKDDEDWACPPAAWSSGPSEFSIPLHVAPTWELALAYVCERVASYITDGKHPRAAVLRNAEAVCAGFVDGNLTVIWAKNSDRGSPLP
ncbi:MAG: hypothetical protein V4857_12825 [Pseudomonadota bacterium]